MKFSAHSLGFTKSEARIILLAIIVLTVGFCIKFYDDIFGSDKKSYDFTKSDMQFGIVSEKKEMSSGTQVTDQILNINTATAEELIALDGIGESLAAEIVSYREKNGNFSRPQDLIKVNGIGKKKFEKIKDKIKVK